MSEVKHFQNEKVISKKCHGSSQRNDSYQGWRGKMSAEKRILTGRDGGNKPSEVSDTCQNLVNDSQ